MFFRNRTKPKKSVLETAEDTLYTAENTTVAPIKKQIQHTSAATAHLIGPGCVKLRGDIPIWKPVDGTDLAMHPEYLGRIFCYGNVDFSTAVLTLFWTKGIVVSFLSKDCRTLLGRLEPSGDFPNLQRIQHLAAANSIFSASMAKNIVRRKIALTRESVRYYQQQGKGNDAGHAVSKLKEIEARLNIANTVDSMRGFEGLAAACWFGYWSSLLPQGWGFDRRCSHPPTDPANAMLSLGYTLAMSRCSALLAAADLDPCVGFLHDIRPGRPSLACDLVESLRVPMVDRLVMSLVRKRQVTLDSFEKDNDAWRLTPAAFKLFLSQFETLFNGDKKEMSFHALTCKQIEEWTRLIREFEVHQS